MTKLVDEKFKDASPLDTVNKIKKILADNGLSVTETWGEHSVRNCYALRINLDGTLFGTNGKGVTEELANASAHAELMERLQAGFFPVGSKTRPSDYKMLDRQSLKELSLDYFETLSKLILKLDGANVTPDQLLEKCFDYEGGGDQTEALPYYSVTEDKLIYLPTRLITPLYTSTGNCAGNSPEEAMVQGFSEIVERWFQRHFMCQKLVPPTIPEEYLKQFPLAYEAICDIRKSGYDVLIKDLSMGSGYPVIATAVLSKKNHAYHVHCGASPVFEIALQRSLTETFQGRVLNSVTDTSLSDNVNDSVGTFRASFLQGRGAYPIEFFTENSSFPFVPFEDRSQCTNRELVQYILQFLKERNMRMYVRDTSIMGFCSYKLIVPEMCNAHFGFLTSVLPVPRLQGNTKSIRLNLKKATPDQLLELQLLHMYYLNEHLENRNPACSKLMFIPVCADSRKDSVIGLIHIAYTEWACGNKMAALDYIKQIGETNVEGISDYFSCLHRTISMLKGSDLPSVLEKLSLFYEASVIDEVRTVVTEKANPFANYIVRCTESCDGCPYQEGCYVENHRAVAQILSRYIEAFDYPAAMARIQALFRSL